ncbi:sensor histidine kinase [Nocardia brasiliensis]|uniref:sensor histidine kinase n=1 Tax=Nocardia brasiliensis TaxID=37326 RepID=UPI000E031F1F|nr:histidine kinase [Nocardia brasiliensis]SUB55621.1 Sensor histidine kinase desK [Nocardia brasiliensis]
MRRSSSWLGAAVGGFAKAALLAAAAVILPALSVAPAVVSALLGSAWSWRNPWSWVGVLMFFVPLAFVFARRVGALFRRLVARWCGIVIEDGYRRPETAPEPVRLSTGYWWNGHSYERSRRDAEADQQWRRRIGDPAYRRDVRWVVIAAVIVGPVCAVPVAALAGAVIAFAHPTSASVIAGVLLVAVAVASAPYAWRIVGPLAHRWLRLSEHAATAERMRELELQHADLTTAQAAEIRRIERDLHDGAQARLVAVGLSLATAEKLMDHDPARARALLREAREGTSSSLAELRELVRGVNPPVLVERGVVEAIRALALDSPVDVRVEAPDRIRLDVPVEAAVYFAVAELLANAAKHAPSGHVHVRIRDRGRAVEVDVDDDGPGGAEVVPGGGLDGIRRRLAAFDGALTLASPAGGPTQARMVVPCESS